jgi:hypothetical protein
MPLETIIRPFQTGNSTPPDRVYSSAKQPPLVVITPGRTGGSVKSGTAHVHVTATFYIPKTPTEVTQQQ